jgi:hypothetical protein
MIHVFFVAGMFGSTIEYVLRRFTQEYDSPDVDIKFDGSMHLFRKEMHIGEKKVMLNDLKKIQPNSITTPMYPFLDLHLPEILDYFSPYLEDSRLILVYADNLRSTELNILFQYHKCCIGANRGLGIFCGDNVHNIKNWNLDYQHWTDLKPWELREWFSLFYVEWTQEWIQSQHRVCDNFLKITNTDILYKTNLVLSLIIDHCNLTPNGDLESFVTKWQQAQQYIVDEFELLDLIVESTINQKDFSWHPTHVIAEAIVQQRLRAYGYEIRCDGLDIFPTDSKTLYNLLEKC